MKAGFIKKMQYFCLNFPELRFMTNIESAIMNKILIKSLPHVAALLLFLCLSFGYFPALFEGKVLIGHDTRSWSQMAHETVAYNTTHDDVTLWTNSMFGGMPVYQISTEQPYNLVKYLDELIAQIPRPAYFLFLYLLCFYLCGLAFRLNPWQSILASLAFTFASYNLIIIAAGHNSKAITIAYMAPLVASVWLSFRGRRLLGALLTALFLSLMIRANHIQIIYYTFFVLLCFGLAEFVYSIRKNEMKAFAKTAALLLAAAFIAVGMNATNLMTTYEYSCHTMRGQSNGLTSDAQSTQSGLNKDYITQWSYGVGETLTLLVPNYQGGASGATLSADSHTGRKLKSFGLPDVDRIMKNMRLPLYWGTQPFTSGPVYAGAIVCLLFVFGLFVVDKRILLWLLPAVVLATLLSWGRNFMCFTEFFIDYVPLYNKFRTVSMTLVVTCFGMALVAALSLKALFDPARDKKAFLRPLAISTAVVGGMALLLALFPALAGDFVAPSDAQFQGDYAFLRETLPLDRKELLVADAWRSLCFILLAAALVFLYIKNYLKAKVVYLIMGVLLLADMMPVAKRYLNDSNFEEKRKERSVNLPSPADKKILEDKSYYRVLDMTVDIFNDAAPSYFHKNIGGYHAAKLRRYQELINAHLDGEIRNLAMNLQRGSVEEAFRNSSVLNMLNLKYLIYNKEADPLLNPFANGNAWFVQTVHLAENADEEMRLTGEIDTRIEAVVDKQYAGQIPAELKPDSSASIVLLDYAPNRLRYRVHAESEQLAVFSEIYYGEGWNAYINGEKHSHLRANYLLRAMSLKAGSYELEFRFEPLAYKLGNSIALTTSLLFIGALLLVAGLYWRKTKKEKI